MRRLLVSSRNTKKIEEIVHMLAGLPCEVIGLEALGDDFTVVEDGKSFEENAAKKARQAAAASGELALGEDSGLCVDALDGRPGIFSSRYCREGDDEANNTKLLEELSVVPDELRGARYVSCVALAEPGELLTVVRGECEGVIGRERRGTHGFGYDPLFIIPHYSKTFAELGPDIKHAMSHRYKAFRELKGFLADYLGVR